AKGRNVSTCPKSFSCGEFTDLSFPFSLSTQPDCGMMSMSGCDAKPYPRIQLVPGGEWYYVLKMHDSSVWLGDPKLQTTLTQHKCQAFNKNFSLPYSPSISFNMNNLINIFKCISSSNNVHNITQKKNDHFVGYNMYSGCEGFSIYYKLSDEYIGADNIPTNCSLVRLPIQSSHGDLFNMLGPEILVEWKLSEECNECHYGGGQCQTDKTNKFSCHKDAKTPTSSTDQRIVTTERNMGELILVTGASLSTVGLSVLLLFCFREKKLWYKYLMFWESNAEDHQKVEEFLKNYGSYAPNRYNYRDIKRITNRFRSKLGQGGFGKVYRGSLRNGSQVAVKVVNELKGSGEDFINEVASISRTSHVNIVSLVGFCFEGQKRALVYEFMPNGSLEKFIYEERTDSVRQLGWPIIYKIALGIARGLEYLHRGCNTRILHFDIKPHNILLDDNFCPKISDFGLAKLCMKQESIVSMLGPRGTIGYIAPEIVCRNLGGVSHKSDVYSYGMMVLEMVGGRKNVDVGVDRTSEIYFPHWLYRRIELDEELQLIGIMNEEENECARKMVIASLWCIQTDPSNRPSMSKVVEMLEGKVDSLQMPPKPYLYSPSRSETDLTSTFVRLPIQSTHGDLFNVLGPKILVEWKLSDECNECHYGGSQCHTDKANEFSCHKDVIKSIGVANVSTLTAGTSKRGYLQIIWFMVAAGASLFTVGLLVLLFCFREKILWYKYIRFWESNAEDHQKVEEFLKNYGSYAPNRYNYTDIKRITNRFRSKLGQGGFGKVYRGSLRNGSQVAVKVLNELKGSAEDFINEVASISRTSHVNIVSLVGFCFEGHKRALVYEFMPNGSLEKFIYEERSDSVRQLGWPILYKIALGIARGLEYLHRGCNTRILHFDIKPHNILLDDNFCPKISDFGLAKLCMKQESIVSMLGPRGTIGYIAPEIVCRNLGGVSHKSDVYSYGMMVLEMVGGRKNVDVGVDRTSEIYFPHWLYRRIELDEELQLIGIMNEEENECARKMVIASLWCIQTDPSNRPSMSKVVEMLEGKLDSLQMPPKPYLYSPSRSEVDSSIIERTTTTTYPV
ncbi:hypothetical protein KY289_025576, partial [Solanum tuberosum]